MPQTGSLSIHNELDESWTIFKQSLNPSSFLAGSIAGCSGILIGHPFDSLKVRMQVGRNLPFKNFSSKVIQELYRGITPPLVTVGVLAAFNFAMYESFKNILHKLDPSTKYLVPKSQGEPLSHIFLAGALSGSIISVVTSPLSVVKIQLQVAKESTVWNCIRDLYHVRGIRTFYRGSFLTWIMESPGRGVYLWTYETMKVVCHDISQSTSSSPITDYLSSLTTNWPTIAVDSTVNRNYPLYLRTIAASFAGVFSWLAIYPFDVIKARLQLDVQQQKYPSIWDCIISTYREGGIRNFFRGLSYTLIRACPVAAVILPVYDVTKQFLDIHVFSTNNGNGNGNVNEEDVDAAGRV
jgi:solute carrier family 25 (mitochondrial carnitine/acylcarnitine transporter), member 20/29